MNFQSIAYKCTRYVKKDLEPKCDVIGDNQN